MRLRHQFGEERIPDHKAHTMDSLMVRIVALLEERELTVFVSQLAMQFVGNDGSSLFGYV